MGDRLSRLLRDTKMAGTAAAFREDLDVHDADLHDHQHITMPDGPHAHVHAHDGTDHSHMHTHILQNPYRSGDGGWIADRIDREWTPVLQDLLELEAAGALGGIRAIIAERLRQVRGGRTEIERQHFREILDDLAGLPGMTLAALLAAEIDRQQPGGGS